MRPVLPRLAQRAAEHQRAEARAVDEQLALDRAAVLEHERGDVAARRVLQHFDDLALGALHPDAEAEFAHERAEQRRVELVGIAVGRCEARVFGRRRELAGERRLDRERVAAERVGAALALHLEPVVVEADAGEFLAEAAERVDVAFAEAAEVAEIDAQLVGRVGGPDERVLVDAEAFDEAADVRQGRFTDADDADVLALDQLDLDQIAEQLRQRRGAHPSGRAAP